MLGLLLQHQNSKAHEELHNTGALSIHPAEELDVARLVSELTARAGSSMLTQSVCCGVVFLLLKAVDAGELEANRDGVIHVVQVRLARKTLVKLRD